MSDAPSISTVLSARVQREARDDSSSLKIVKIPESLERNEKPQRLRGEVRKVERDGTIHIKTDKGDIVAKDNGKTSRIVGEDVEIIIAKGDPPSTAQIKPQVQNLSSAPIEPPPPQQQIYINTTVQTPITPQRLTALPSVAVEYIPSQNLPNNLVLPFVESIVNDFIAQTDFTSTIKQQVFEGTPIQTPLPQITQNIIAPSSLQEASASITTETIAQPIRTEIPIAYIAAKLISSPLSAPITFGSEEETAPIIFKEISITTLSSPDAKIIEEDKSEQIMTTERSDVKVGETKAIVEGFTKDQHFPVLRILGDTDQHYSLKIPVTDIPVGTKVDLNILQTVSLQPPVQLTSTIPLPSIAPAPFLLTPEIWGNL